jgi:response regulator of citrate/malate metabolism
MPATMAQAANQKLLTRFWSTAPVDDKVAAVLEAVTNTWRSTLSIAVDLKISTATATKYLHLAVRRGLVIASPELHRAKTGSTKRRFRRATMDDERPDMDEGGTDDGSTTATA